MAMNIENNSRLYFGTETIFRNVVRYSVLYTSMGVRTDVRIILIYLDRNNMVFQQIVYRPLEMPIARIWSTIQEAR